MSGRQIAARNRSAGCGSGCPARSPKTLILHWNGTAWTRLPSPTPAGGGPLYGVAAASDRNPWAVGQTGTSATPRPKTLDLHWNGTTWS